MIKKMLNSKKATLISNKLIILLTVLIALVVMIVVIMQIRGNALGLWGMLL